jgi:Leucine-rich repeat (LRR) protein
MDPFKHLIFSRRLAYLVTQTVTKKPVLLRRIFQIWAAVSILLSCDELSAFPKPPILNASTDLEQLPGDYQKSNMLPNIPGQDSAPLLNDAIGCKGYPTSRHESSGQH